MNSCLVMGLFALYVVAVSLGRYLREEEFFRLTAMKRLWGRSRGLVMYFVSHVALPMVLGIVFIAQAVVQDGSKAPAVPNIHNSLSDRGIASVSAPDGKPPGESSSRAYPSVHFLSEFLIP
jgi:hypothetical protein